ncbi:MAG: enoyl-CoA hydratase/carnithine racemase [Halioglobus sp.]|jgi:enoyl-CoA hydratase/carnithine racemase
MPNFERVAELTEQISTEMPPKELKAIKRQIKRLNESINFDETLRQELNLRL